MMGAQIYYLALIVSCSFPIFLRQLVILLSFFVLQLFQQAMATSAHLKKHTMDLKKANQKIHGLEKELKQTRVELSDAGNVAKIAIGQRNKAQQEVVELQKVACGEVF